MNEPDKTLTSSALFPSTLREWLNQLGIAGLYLLLGYVVRHNFSDNDALSLIWPSSGLSLAVLLIGGRSYLWSILLGSMLLNALFHDSLWLLSSTTLIHTLEALLGAWLLNRHHRAPLSLVTLSDYIRLIILGGAIPSMVAANLGLLLLSLSGIITTANAYFDNLSHCWMGDTLGVVLVTPFVLTWQQEKFQPLKLKKIIENLFLLSLCFVAGQIVFLDWLQAFLSDAPRGYWMFFFVTWIAIRMGSMAVTAVLLMIAIQGLASSYLEIGYFAHEISKANLHNYWPYMLTLSIVSMALNTYVAETKQTLQRLQLKDSALNAAANTIVITDSEGRIEWANQAFTLLTGFSLDEAYLHNPRDLLKSGKHDDAYYQFMWETILANHVWHDEIINRRKDGSLYDEEMTITPLKNEQGQITHFIAVKHEITERKRIETELRESHQQIYSLLNSIAEGAYGMDVDGNCTFVNQAFLDLLGYDNAEEIVGQHIHELIHHSHADGTPYPSSECQIYAAFRLNEKIHAADEVFWRKDRVAIPVEYWSQPIVIDGTVTGAIATFVDISDRITAEHEMRIAATVFESQQGMMVTDAYKNILRVNQAFTTITGYSSAEVIGKHPRILHSSRQTSDFYAAMRETINSSGTWEGEIWNQRKNGEIYPEYLSITAVKDQDGEISNYVATFADITAHKKAADEIERLAFYDPLTRLPNRRLLLDRLKPALAASHRSGRKGALLFIDLDNFKNLNDSLGHDMGDLLLQQVAERLTSCVREIDTVARLGGDEFVVMLEDLHEETAEALTQIETVGNKILAILNHPYQLATHEYRSTPSIGATFFNGENKAIDDLLKQADIAMYQAKASGRNALRFFDPQMQANINTRVALEADLHQALAEQQFQLHYQLQINQNNQSIGAEVLLRWQHPQRGLLYPADFLTVAEESGLILPIGAWVLQTACAQLKRWENNPTTENLLLAVNISARQFRQTSFVAQVRQIITDTGINPHRLKLELTEAMVLGNFDETTQKMNALHEIGVHFSIDDFGTSRLSLAYLTRLPLNQIKIDQSFISNIGMNISDEMIVETIIGIAKNLGMRVIAEGVETKMQRDFLAQRGCLLYQGYLFSKPLPLASFEALLQQK